MDLTKARVIFTKDFLNKTEGQLSPSHKAALIRERLVEVQESGQLAKAKSRYEVAELLGYEGKSRTGHTLVSTKVRTGALEERFGHDEQGAFRHFYIYHPEKEAYLRKRGKRRRRKMNGSTPVLTKKYPDFSEVNAEIAKDKERAEKIEKFKALYGTREQKDAQKEQKEEPKTNDTVVRITYRGVTVEADVSQVEFIAQLIKKLGE